MLEEKDPLLKRNTKIWILQSGEMNKQNSEVRTTQFVSFSSRSKKKKFFNRTKPQNQGHTDEFFVEETVQMTIKNQERLCISLHF